NGRGGSSPPSDTILWHPLLTDRRSVRRGRIRHSLRGAAPGPPELLSGLVALGRLTASLSGAARAHRSSIGSPGADSSFTPGSGPRTPGTALGPGGAGRVDGLALGGGPCSPIVDRFAGGGFAALGGALFADRWLVRRRRDSSLMPGSGPPDPLNCSRPGHGHSSAAQGWRGHPGRRGRRPEADRRPVVGPPVDLE